VFPETFRKWLRAVFERGCLAGWMLLMAANTVIFGLAVELLVFGTVFSFSRVMLINGHTAPFLVLGVLATFNFPLVFKLRQYGVENLNFEIHENALNRFIDPPESWSTVILTLLDETALRSHELVILVRLIDEAPGPVERQDRRAEAKAWLKGNRDKLTDEDKEFVNEYLGYLG
jgi:hypothetical protein